MDCGEVFQRKRYQESWFSCDSFDRGLFVAGATYARYGDSRLSVRRVCVTFGALQIILESRETMVVVKQFSCGFHPFLY